MSVGWKGVWMGFAAGVVAGYLLGRSHVTEESAAPRPGDAASSAPHAAGVGAAPPPPPPARPSPGLETPHPPRLGGARITPATTLDAGAEPAAGEGLEVENARLREELAAEREAIRQLRALHEGEVQPKPADLPPRFGQEVLRRALQDALKELELENVQVSSVDCTEHPCILYGEGDGQPDFHALRKAPALSAYAKDGQGTSVWVRNEGDAGPRFHFGITLYPRPKEPGRGDALSKRLNWRMGQMREAMPLR